MSLVSITPCSKMKEQLYRKYIACLDYSHPIGLHHLEGRPGYVFHETIITPQRGNWAVHLIR